MLIFKMSNEIEMQTRNKFKKQITIQKNSFDRKK